MLRSIARMFVPAALVAAAIGPLAAQEGPTPKYKRDLPAKLLSRATVKEADAAKIAQAKFPNARIQAVELENEDGRLIYSYELKTAGKSGIDEVNVNAKTGKLVNTEHEGAKAESREAAQEKSAKRPSGETNR